MLSIQRPTDGITLLKSGNDLVVAGYASVELVDKQGDLITRSALKDAFDGFMKGEKYRNVQLAHSNIQVGEVIDSYIDSNGRMWKSETDDTGLFVVVKLRNDIEKAREVAAEIRKGNLRGFSIGGQAFKRVRKSDMEKGDYQEISKMELHEVTICEKGINPEAQFRILKEDTNMTDENSDLTEIMSRLESRLDAMEKGELPPQLREHMKSKKGGDEEKDSDEKEDDKMKMKDEDEKDHDDKMAYMKGEEYSDVISSEYLSWMENTLKSAGVDTDGARAHFDGISKANLGSTPESIGDGASYFAGQVNGRAQEGGSPSTNALARAGLSRGGEVSKGDFLTSIDPVSAEEAYEVFKAAKQEEELRKALEGNFEQRYNHERTVEVEKAQAQAFDARGPLDEVMKALGALNERIDNLSTDGGTVLAKSADAAPTVAVPETADLANMSWDEVHSLANRAIRGE